MAYNFPVHFKKSFTILIFYFFLILFFTSSLPAHSQLFPQGKQEEKEVQWPDDLYGRRTPRGAVSGFLTAVAEGNYERAANYMNLSKASIDKEGSEMARILEHFLNRGGQILPYSWISSDPKGRTDDTLPPNLERIGSVVVEGESIDLFLEEATSPEGGPIWLISSATIEKLNNYSEISENVLLVDRLLPAVLKRNEWNGVPAGQWLLMVVMAVLSYAFIWGLLKILFFLIPKIFPRAGKEPAAGFIKAFALPVQLYLAVLLFVYVTQETGISIIARQKFSGITVIVGMLAFLILLWRLSEYIGRFGKNRMDVKGNVSGLSIVLFLQRAAKVAIVIFGIIAILDTMGVDVTTGLAALGIGGIALALGAQKTVENFVGSVTVITDQPVRVGDFCKVGNILGTVEKIGMRSTRIRTLDRTLVTIPNGQFSSENIENYAHRDKFRFYTVFGLRFETSPDQLRYLLVKLREALYAHPLVSPDPARVRFIGMGADSLNLEIFAFITVSSYDHFLEVREDLLLQMMDIVEESGTGFAFPSQTLYFNRDSGLSKEKSRKAEEKVKNWREKEELHIPQFDPQRLEELQGTTPYPPQGSSKRKNEETGKIPGL